MLPERQIEIGLCLGHQADDRKILIAATGIVRCSYIQFFSRLNILEMQFIAVNYPSNNNCRDRP